MASDDVANADPERGSRSPRIFPALEDDVRRGVAGDLRRSRIAARSPAPRWPKHLKLDRRCARTAARRLRGTATARARRRTSTKTRPPPAAYLCKQSPSRMTGYINYSNAILWKLWGNLEDAIREGTNRWQQTFGWDGPIFSNFFRTEEAMREFLMGMHGYGLISSPHVVAAFDLSRFRRLVDLGGATGHLAIAACQRYPA